MALAKKLLEICFGSNVQMKMKAPTGAQTNWAGTRVRGAKGFGFGFGYLFSPVSPQSSSSSSSSLTHLSSSSESFEAPSPAPLAAESVLHPSNSNCKACNDKENYLTNSGSLQNQDTHNNNNTSNNDKHNNGCNCLSYAHSGCPLSRAEVGRAAWAYLHTIAAWYPSSPSLDQSIEMKKFMESMARTYPCNYCADKTLEELQRNPPRTQSQKQLSLWLCEIHNEVNERLGKKIFDCDKVDIRWKTGPNTGECD